MGFGFHSNLQILLETTGSIIFFMYTIWSKDMGIVLLMLIKDTFRIEIVNVKTVKTQYL